MVKGTSKHKVTKGQGKSRQARLQLGRTGSLPRTVPKRIEIEAVEPLAPIRKRHVVFGAVVLAVVFVWSYWPTLVRLIQSWGEEPDYSHGYIVVPVALYFLWFRRKQFPKTHGQIAWLGVVPILLSFGMRYASSLVYIEAIDAWSMILWIAGVVWLLGGWKVVWWSAPSVTFLLFMVPLPYRVERWLSLPLQAVAAKLSCAALQCLAQPCLTDGYTILLGEHRLEVEEACSGLRIFVGILALAFVYLVLVRRSWWEKLLLIASVLPIAMISNVARIVLTGILCRYVSTDVGQAFTHDFAGWVMIPFSACLFSGWLWYLGKLIYEVEPLDVSAAINRGNNPAAIAFAAEADQTL